MALWVLGAEPALAQPVGGEQPAGAAGPSSLSPMGQYPRSPFGFVRGNLSADGRAVSNYPISRYINLVGLIPILALFFLFVHTTQWVDEDGRQLKLNYGMWNSLVFLVGVFGFVVVFLLPVFALGFPLLLAAYGVPLALYVKERNDRVRD